MIADASSSSLTCVDVWAQILIGRVKTVMLVDGKVVCRDDCCVGVCECKKKPGEQRL